MKTIQNIKKALVALAAVGLTFAANAATYNWSISYTRASPAEPLNSFDGQYKAFLFLLAEDTDFSTITSQIAKGVLPQCHDWVLSTVTSDQGQRVVTFSKETNPIADPSGLVAYSIIIDAANIDDAKYYIAATGGTSEGTYEDDGHGVHLDALTSTDLSWDNQYSSNWAGIWRDSGGGSSIPEPTSALLLMMGLATLALRRKQK